MKNLPQIFIVEDEQIVALDLKHRVQRLGYDVLATVASGDTALAYIQQNQPDLILMDIRLQGHLDGIETARRIQQQYDIPIIYLTASTDDETMKRAETTHPAGYVFKPFDDEMLGRTIQIAFDSTPLPIIDK
jgi:CheY-like chemotaxis protein